ncbi:hypothetical protein L1987_19611 [Smallanthus sonchifolius]|uniref:Uncharacterized protein n=1 Tax=Smallanthus sonchifolius TaxID=185202 RepID=A0ACB9IQA2_9ASTR|nr:hypothetical protein L1987_19611 [Smallanthus sonchifolius]
MYRGKNVTWFVTVKNDSSSSLVIMRFVLVDLMILDLIVIDTCLDQHFNPKKTTSTWVSMLGDGEPLAVVDE